MNCYYRAALVLDSDGVLIDSRYNLICAYKTLSMLCGDRLYADVLKPYSGNQFRSNTIPETEEDDSPPNLKINHIEFVPNYNLKNILCTKREINRIFNGDSNLLKTVIYLLVTLASNFMINDTESADKEIAAELYDEVIHIIKIVTSSSISDASSPISPNSSILSDDNTLNPDVNDYFSFFNDILLLYRDGKLLDDPMKTKECEVCELFITLASTSEEYSTHLIASWCFARNLYFDLYDIKRSVELSDLIKDNYDMDKHSLDLISLYGSDHVLQTLSCNLHVLVMQGNIYKVFYHYFLLLLILLGQPVSELSAVHVIEGYGFSLEYINNTSFMLNFNIYGKDIGIIFNI